MHSEQFECYPTCSVFDWNVLKDFDANGEFVDEEIFIEGYWVGIQDFQNLHFFEPF